MDDTIMVPLTTGLYRLSRDPRYVNMIYASADSVENLQAAEEEITDIIRSTHRLVEGQDNDFTVRTQTELTEAFSSTTKALTSLLGAIAGVSLFVGGVGIMNIMLVSVTERTREIGVMRAIGAVDFRVLQSVVIEALVIGAITWVLAIFLSFPISLLLLQIIGSAMLGSIPALIFTPMGIFIWLVVVALLSIVASILPARNAVRLTINEVLSYE